MSEIKVKTSRELSAVECQQIHDIMTTSQCPNETLIASIPDCTGYHDGYVVIGTGELKEITL